MKKYLMDEIPDEELPEIDELTADMRLVAEVIGVRQALRLAERLGGTTIVLFGFPKWWRRWRDKRIRAAYDAGGITAAQLGRRHQLTERQVYTILGMSDGGVAMKDERQLKLF